MCVKLDIVSSNKRAHRIIGPGYVELPAVWFNSEQTTIAHMVREDGSTSVGED